MSTHRCADPEACPECRAENYGCSACGRERWWAWGIRYSGEEWAENEDCGESCWEHLPDTMDYLASDPKGRLLWAEWTGSQEVYESFELWRGPKGWWTAQTACLDKSKTVRRVAATAGQAFRKLQALFPKCAEWRADGEVAR